MCLMVAADHTDSQLEWIPINRIGRIRTHLVAAMPALPLQGVA